MTSLKNPATNQSKEICWNCGQTIDRQQPSHENAATLDLITPLDPNIPGQEWIIFVSGAHRDHIPQTGERLPVKSLRAKKWEQQVIWYEAVKPLPLEQILALRGIGWEGDLEAMRSGSSPCLW